jgi:hypothetical protein
MKLGAALKKINAEAKRLKKLHPSAKYVNLQKMAGKAYKAGKLKGKIGSSGNTRTATKASTSRNRTATKTITSHIKVGAVRKRKRRRKVGKVATVRVIRRTIIELPKRKRHIRKKVMVRAKSRRKVSGVGSTKSILMPLILVGGGLLLYELLKPKTAVPMLIPKANPTANAAQNSLLQYAQYAGLAATGIAALINSLNNSSDDSVIAANNNQASTVQQIQNTMPSSEVTAGDGSSSFLNSFGI